MKGKGKFVPHKGGGLYLYISKKLSNDSAFPFKPYDEVNIRIVKGKLIIEPVKSSNKEDEENWKKLMEVRKNFEQKHRGKWVVIANGQIVAIGDDIKEVLEKANKVTNYKQHRILWKVGEKIEEQAIRKIRGRSLRRKET